LSQKIHCSCYLLLQLLSYCHYYSIIDQASIPKNQIWIENLTKLRIIIFSIKLKPTTLITSKKVKAKPNKKIKCDTTFHLPFHCFCTQVHISPSLTFLCLSYQPHKEQHTWKGNEHEERSKSKRMNPQSSTSQATHLIPSYI
jgi:hypothetical protein